MKLRELGSSPLLMKRESSSVKTNLAHEKI